MGTLAIIHQQQIVEHPTPEITVARPKFPESTRRQIRIALIGLPVAAAVVMVSVFLATQRRQRLLVPGHLKKGLKHYYQRDYDQAIREFNTALAISPYRGEAYLQRGTAYEARGEIDRALADYSRATQLDPRLAAAFIRRGRIRTDRSDFDGALADFERALEIRPCDAETHLNRGICQFRRGILNEAVADFERVLKLTNHSDYAEPAKQYLQELGVGDRVSLPGPVLGTPGNAEAHSEPAPPGSSAPRGFA
jgi:tetratricopeptide (TPR) repeat protein